MSSLKASAWISLFYVLSQILLCMSAQRLTEDDTHNGWRTSQVSDAVIEQMAQKLSALQAELQAVKTGNLQSAGSTFIRWGRTSCPANTVLVYSGIAGGSHYNHLGASNRLCLSLNPVVQDVVLQDPNPSHLYGARYKNIPGVQDQNVACAVCKTPHDATVMVPGTQLCPLGWQPQYAGHLTGNHEDDGSGEYLCLDSSPEGVKRTPEGSDSRSESPSPDSGSERPAVAAEEGALFRYTVAVCGSLPCPPYLNNTVVTCVVCSQ